MMRKHIPALIIFTILLVVMTFPLVFNINSHIPGFFSTDEIYAPISEAWRVKFSVRNQLPILDTNLMAYPFGRNIYRNMTIGYLFLFINFTLAFFTSPILTYNLQAILNFLLTALFTYFLVYYLSKSRFCAILSGAIFGFSPFIFVRSWQHLAETYLWPMPFFLFYLFKLKDHDSFKIKSLFLISFLTTTISFGTTYYASVIFGTYLLYLLRSRRENKTYLKKVLILATFTSVLFILQFLPVISNVIFHKNGLSSAQNIFHRPFEDLFYYSAKPLSYLLPAVVHPIFGKFTEQFIGSPFYGQSFTEHTLYLGWTPIILAFIAFRTWRRKRKNYKSEIRSPKSQTNLKLQVASRKLQHDEDFYIGFFVLLAVVAWSFSQPPWWRIGQVKIFMPSFFMYKILPMFRAYCRFGIVVMLAVSVLAGFGLKFILEQFRAKRVKFIVTVLFCGLVLFEFWNYPPLKVIDVSKVPQVYYWLREQSGDFAIAEYPLDWKGPNEMYKLYQTKHEKKMINATMSQTYANNVAKSIVRLSEPMAACILKWMGVKYVLVHTETYLNSELVEERQEVDKIHQISGLKLIKSFASQECPQKDIMCVQKTGPIDVYEVVAKPIKPEI